MSTTRYSRIVWHHRNDPTKGSTGDWLDHDLAPLAHDLNRRYPMLSHRVEYTDGPDVGEIVANLFAAGREAKSRALA